MALLNINLTDVSTEAPKMNPGMYDLKVVKAEYSPAETGADGKEKSPMVNVCFRNNATGDEDKARVYDRFWLNTEALWRLKKFLLKAGLPADINELDTDTLIGAVVRAKVTTNTYTDKSSGEVKENAQVKDYLDPQ